MPDDNQSLSQPQPDQPHEEQPNAMPVQPTPTVPPPPVSIVQLLKEEAEEPDHKERPLAPGESAEAVYELIELFHHTLTNLPAFTQAKSQGQQDGFVVFTVGDSAYSVYDQVEEDKTSTMLIKKMAVSQRDDEALRNFAPSEGATQLLLNSFSPDAEIEAVIAFESPSIHWTMRDTAGEEFPWPVQNTTLAVAQAAKLAAELVSQPATPAPSSL